jgi:tetratricopeptide (TPR) repeat protein
MPAILRSAILLMTVTFLFSCSLLEKADSTSQNSTTEFVLNKKADTKPTTAQIIKRDRSILFENAEIYYLDKNYDEALRVYLKITREAHDTKDELYDKSLLRLAEIYEVTDQSEKAILALEELNKRNSGMLSTAALSVLLMKNHYRVTNYHQARILRFQLDQLYKSQEVSLQDIYSALYYQTTLYYDRHVLDELLFIGDMQKYFVFVMESSNLVEAEKLTDLLILYYERFLEQLNKSVLSREFKRRLIISLLDQLGKFDKYKLADGSAASKYLIRFSQFAEQHRLTLTERLTNGQY